MIQILRIQQLRFFEILDSRGLPTVKAFISLDNGYTGTMEVPSGKSVGTYEAVEKRDKDLPRYHGQGMQKCLDYAQNAMNSALKNRDFHCFKDLDRALIELDGTPQKSHLGANFILAASGAFARACANAEGKSLHQYLQTTHGHDTHHNIIAPKPMVNVINGGAHADNNLAIQEFMLVPIQSKPLGEYMRMLSEIFHTLKDILHKHGLPTNVGDEGGFAPRFSNTKQVLDTLCQATEKAGYSLGEHIGFALDCAANDFYKDGYYVLDGEKLSIQEYMDVLANLCTQYPLISIEDPIHEDDWQGWQTITKNLGTHPNCTGIMIVGDDLFVTQEKRLRQGIGQNAANAILIKPNQVGTVTETLQTIHVAQQNNYNFIVSHRSGETTDTFIADFALAVKAPYVKFGSMSRGERVCKYNRLMALV